MLAIVAWLAAAGCKLPCAAGVIANLEIESGLDPGSVSGSGIGLPQWAGVRRRRLLTTLGAGWRDGYAQLRHVVTELTEMGLRDELFASTDPAAATRLFMLEFERPHSRDPRRRVARAKAIYRELWFNQH